MNTSNFTIAAEKWLSLAVLSCALLVLPTSFVYEKGGRILFYLCSYFSIIAVCVNFRKYGTSFLKSKSAHSLLFLGAIFIIWSFYSDNINNLNNELLFTAGKRCILSFFILGYFYTLLSEKESYDDKLRKWAIYSVVAAFVTSSIYAFFQAIITTDPANFRVVLGINRATLTAYAYSALSLALLTLVLQLNKNRLRELIFFTVATISLYVIFLTQTRSSIAIHLIFIAYLTYRLFLTSRSYKFIAVLSIAIVLCASASYKIIESRLDTTVQEIYLYKQGDDKTSLGSRFTMWKTGILSFKRAPFGQDLEERNKFIKDYLYAENKTDSMALEYIDVHLHNEIIQYASTFGVVGVVALIYFYWCNIISVSRSVDIVSPTSVVTFSTLLYGSTDVLMTSVEYIVIYTMLITMLMIISTRVTR